MYPRFSAMGVLAVFVVAAPVASQGVAVSARGSTLGLGGEVSFGIGSSIGVRGGFNVQPWEPEREWDGVEYTLDLASPSWSAMIDLHPGGGGFRLSGGVLAFGSDNEIRARLTEPVEIGATTYTPEQVGTLTGQFDTREFAPYVGIGLGRLGGRKGLGLVLDLGVAYVGSPGVSLAANGPLASQPAFQADLAAEARNLEEDAKSFRFYPVLSFGLAFGF